MALLAPLMAAFGSLVGAASPVLIPVQLEELRLSELPISSLTVSRLSPSEIWKIVDEILSQQQQQQRVMLLPKFGRKEKSFVAILIWKPSMHPPRLLESHLVR